MNRIGKKQYKLPKILNIYEQSDFAIQQKAAFTYYMILSVLVSMLFIIVSSIYIQNLRTEVNGIYLPVIFLKVALMFLLIFCLVLLIKGFYGFATHLLMISGITAIWVVMWIGKGHFLTRLDTVIMIVALLNLAPLFITKYQSAIWAYISANIVMLFIFMWFWASKMGLPLSASIDYIIDAGLSILFTGAIGYNIFIINKKTLNRALDEINERKKSEEIVKENELFRSRIFDSSRIAIVVMDGVSFDYIDCNPAAAVIYGFPSRESTIGKSPLEVSAPNQYDGTPSAEKAQFFVNKAKNEGNIVFEWLHCRPDGVLWDAEVHLMSFISGNRNLFQFSLIDITERKKAENALKESEEKYRYLMQNMNEVVMMVDNNDRVLLVNNKFTEKLGYTPEEIIGKIGYEVLLDKADQAIILEENKSRIEKRFNQYELPFIGKDGFKIEFLVSGAPIIDSKGKTIGSIGTMTDITERKKAEKALKESEELFKNLIELAPFGIVLNDREGKHLLVNKAYCFDTGFEAIELIGKTQQEIGLKFKEGSIHFMIEEIRNKGFFINFETSYQAKQGNIVDCLYSSKVIQINNKKAVLTSAVNITDKKKIEKELEKYRDHLEKLVKERTDELAAINEELSATNEELYAQKEELHESLNKLNETQKQLVHSEKMASLGILSAGIAHEINNPLNFIQGGVIGLDNFFKDNFQEYPEKTELFLDAIKTGISRSTAIVTSLNHYSRQDDSNHTSCNLHQIIDNCLIMLQSEIKNRLEVNKVYAVNLPDIKGNEGKLHQAFLNIFSNAIQSISGNGSIDIKTGLKNNQVFISIADSGCGISKENLKKVFDPFFTTKDPGKGTGLGLSITFNIISEHNGTIDMDSEPGKGTEVTMKFKVA